MAAHTLLFLKPAHFHAALTLRQNDPRVDPRIHVYSTGGPDLQRFLAMVESFNARAEQPTHWQPVVYTSADPLGQLIRERKGEGVIIAGRNDQKASSIAQLHAERFAILADKPLLLSADDLGALQTPLASAPSVLDIMTEREDTRWEVTRHLVHDADVFGGWDTSGRVPAIYMDNVHQIHKTVNGRVLQRPTWFFDVGVYGDGIVDIPTHLADLVQWLIGGPSFDFARDVRLISARLWDTPIDAAAFERLTAVKPWPAELLPRVRDGVLPLPCNGELVYMLRSIPVQLKSTWELTPTPTEDNYRIRLEGTRARIEMEHAMAREGRRILVTPRVGMAEAARALDAAVARLQATLPGTSVTRSGESLAVVVPERHERPHEELFSRVLDRFLRALEGDIWDADEARNILCKYTLLAEGSSLANRGRGR